MHFGKVEEPRIDSRFEALQVSVILEAVDCDQRLRSTTAICYFRRPEAISLEAFPA